MASSSSSRSLQVASRQLQTRCRCVGPISRTSITRSFSASSQRSDQEHEPQYSERPRWSYTPHAMKAPFSINPKNPDMAWTCNEDPKKLDQFYTRFLGRGGDKVLTDEIKWLAITHKSFDQGRRGFNDRLAYLGRRILNLQTILTLLNSRTATATQNIPVPTDDRVPFKHPALDGLANVTDVPLEQILTPKRLARLSISMGMNDIMRWKPRNPANMNESGISAVLTTTLYSIIGAIALQKGTDVANAIARERVLKPLGIS